MTKSEKLADEIIKCLTMGSSMGLMTGSSKHIIPLIKHYSEQVHNEAVEQTVMAENKKTFIKPKYED